MGLTYKDILDMEVGLILGLLNEKNNQMIGLKNNKQEEVIQGDASMLMKM